MRLMTTVAGFGLCLAALTSTAFASSFICAEPGGKRLIHIDGNNISKASDDKTLIYIDGHDLLTDPSAKAFLVVDDDDIRPSAAGVKVATFDGSDIRHGPHSDGKVLMNYSHPDLCPTSSANRVYSIEGDALSKQQLVAGLYLLRPEMFKLSDAEIAAQQKAIKEAGAEEDKKAAADQVAGTWTMLNSSGIVEKVGAGTITVAPKLGDAYPVTLDFSKGGGPTWTGAGAYAVANGDKCFYVAYGTPKTAALCVYDIAGGTLKGTWYPWCIDGTAKSLGSETLSGPATLGGTYKINAAAAPFTAAAYTGTVAITPAAIVGAPTENPPFTVVWTIGGVKVYGMGIRDGNKLYVASGAGPDVCIARFKIQNGTMTGDWYKVGSAEHGGSAAMN